MRVHIGGYSRVGNVSTHPEAVSPHVAYFGHYVHSVTTGLRCALANQLKTCREGTNQASSVVLLSSGAKAMLAHPPATLTGICSKHASGQYQVQVWTGPEMGTGSWNQQKSPGEFCSSLGLHA